MQKFAVIVAGGSGSRMGGELPKQFLPLAGKPILMHTLNVFQAYDSKMKLILVLPDQQISLWKSLCVEHDFQVEHTVTAGGKERFNSVKNGLSKIDEDGIVFIHDGVRPLVSHDTLKRCEIAAAENGNAIPVLPATESIRKTEGDGNVAVDRSLYFLVQTPQTFKVSEIKKAYEQEFV